MLFLIETLGCKVNQVESAALEALLMERGHSAAVPGERCDAVIINSCAVTGDASRQSRQTARRLHREHPDALLAVCGCASQIAPGEMEELGAKLIGGSGERRKFVEELEALVAGQSAFAKTVIGEPAKRREIERLPSGAPNMRTRAMLKIQDGCDNYCSYCVIPYARGHVRSLEPDIAVQEATSLASQGFREIVLTGIEISSYGRDLPGQPSLADVLLRISRAVPQIRIRLGSLEPSTVTPEFIENLAGIPNLCEHFHLSLQSGSDEILKRMHRRYETAVFNKTLCLLRKCFPNCGVTADVIVGFPGETEPEFLQTLEFLKKCAFSRLHVFPYSSRPGTKAAEMGGQVHNAEKKERAARAREIGEKTQKEFLKTQVGKTLEVLFERETDNLVFGHARNYAEVAAPSATGENLRNQIKSVVITGESGASCLGEFTV